MNALRRKRGLGLLLPAVLAVVVVNGYAYNQLARIAGNWKMSLLPGSVSVQLTRLALILAANSIAIVCLLVARGRR